MAAVATAAAVAVAEVVAADRVGFRPVMSDELVRLSTLASGIRVVTERMPEARSVSVGAYVGVGGRDEPDDAAGASHFLEHLLFKGTAERTAREIAVAIDAVGGDMNAYTSREHTAFYARVPAPAYPMGLRLLLDVLAAPALRPNEVDGEREVILEELAAAEDDPDDVVHTRLAEALFPGHPLGREVLGEEATIEALSRDAIAAFHERWYRSTNIVVAAAGAIDHDELCAAVDGFLGDRDPGAAPLRNAPVDPPVARVVAPHPGEQAHLALGWRAVDQDDPERYPLAFANYVLGGGMASRLFQAVREERGLAYSIFSSTALHADAGALTVSAATSPARAAEVLTVIEAEIDGLLAGGVTDEEHRTALGYLEGSLVLGLEEPGSRMSRIGRSVVSRGEVVPIDEHLARFRAVTVDDVNRVLRTLLLGQRSLALAGPAALEAVGV